MTQRATETNIKRVIKNRGGERKRDCDKGCWRGTDSERR